MKGSDDELADLVGMFDGTWRCMGVVKGCHRVLRGNDWHQYAITVHDFTCVLTSAVEAEKVLGISVGHVLPYG